MFIAALFVVSRTWKETRCPSTKNGKENVTHLHIGEVFSREKKNDILKFASKCMGLEKKHPE